MTYTADDIEAQIRAALARIEKIDAGLVDLLDAIDIAKAARRDAVSLHSAALYYASVGLMVFPLQPKLKIPWKGSRGCKDGTTDSDQIERWWSARPDANIGIATGHLVDVIDIDGTAGGISWARNMYDDDDIYTGPRILGKVSTPRPGGRHFYVAATGKGNHAGLHPGVDYRGAGGYVVAPPSTTDVGAYTWYVPLRLSLNLPGSA